MGKILITFLGTGNYTEATYGIGGRNYPQTRFFCSALARDLAVDKVLSFHTKRAAEINGMDLNCALQGLDHTAVEIPPGASQAELWEIFHAITEHVPAKAELHVDITHGFRSLPLIAMIALSYLRTTRKVIIGGIHYGAFEAKGTDVVPAFDLTAFVDLLDWSAAADQFLSTGSGARLAHLLRETQSTLWKDRGKNDAGALPRKLSQLAKAIETTSQDLIHLRLNAIPSSVKDVKRLLDEAEAEVGTHARPFLEVIEPVREELGRFADGSLGILRDLIRWLCLRGHTSAALALSREWLTSFTMEWLGVPSRGTNERERKTYDDVLQLLITSRMKNPGKSGKEFSETVKLNLQRLANGPAGGSLEEIARLHGKISTARNDLMHAGYRQHPADSASLQMSARTIADGLYALPLPESQSLDVRECPGT